MTTHNCSISSKSRVHSLGYAPCIPPHKPPPFTPIMHHSPCLPDIQTFLLLNSPSQNQCTSSAADLLSGYLHTPLHPPFINPFTHPFRHSPQLPYLCFQDLIHPHNTQQTSEVLPLHSPNPRPLFLLSYNRLTTRHENRHEQCLIQDPSTLKPHTPKH